MKRKMFCGNEVSENRDCSKITRRSSSNSSCNSFIVFNAIDDEVDVMMNGNGNKKSAIRSYVTNNNRFSCNFHKQQNLLILLVATLLVVVAPIDCKPLENISNVTDVLLTNPTPVALDLVGNQDVSNEISTIVEEKPEILNAAEPIESPLSESLEDNIRNAVKNEIESESNNGSPALLNALDILPEAEKIVIVEYTNETRSTIEANITPKTEIEPKEKEEEKPVENVEVENRCDVNSLICKRIPPPNPASKPTESSEAITASPNIEIEAENTVAPTELDTTIATIEKEVQEEVFDVVEDNNMREGRNFEIKDETPEAKIEEAILKKEPTKEVVNSTKVEHVLAKDVLKSILPIEIDNGNVKGELGDVSKEQVDAKLITPTPAAAVTVEEVPITATDIVESITEVSAPTTNETENISFENIKGETTATDNLQSEDLKGENKPKIDVSQPGTDGNISNVQAEKVPFTNKIVENENHLNFHGTEPILKELDNSKPIKEVAEIVNQPTEATPNDLVDVAGITGDTINQTPQTIAETPNSELNSNSIHTSTSPEVVSDVIIPVVADHADLFAKENLISTSTTIAPQLVQNENSNQKENGTLSIVFEEPLTATEPILLLENPKAKDLLDIEAINIDPIIPLDVTTIIPEIMVHNVIKKQGVEPISAISEDTTNISDLDINTTATPIEQAEEIKEITNPTNPPATTIIPIETSSMQQITEVAVVFPGKGDEDAVSTAKGSRSINSLQHQSALEHHHKASINVDIYPAGQTFNENLAEEMPNGIGKALPTHRSNDEEIASRSTLMIAFSSCIALVFIFISVGIFMVSFQRQHGTLDIEMQEQRCGKDKDDEETETCIKLLDIELPNTSLALQTDAEAEIEECL